METTITFKSAISSALIFLSITSKCQNTFPPSGNVAIGTNSAQALLHVNGNAIIGNSTTGSNSALIIKGPNTPNNIASFQDINYSFLYAGSSRIRAYRGGGWDTYLQFLTNSSSASGDNPQVAMHINQDGNVGIGNTAPSTLQENTISNIQYNAAGLIGTSNDIKPYTGLTLSNYIPATSGSTVQGAPAVRLVSQYLNPSTLVSEQAEVALQSHDNQYNTYFQVLMRRQGTNSNQWTKALSINYYGQFESPLLFSNYGAGINSTANGFALFNDAPATSTQNQGTALNYWRGNGWKTAGTAGSQTMSLGGLLAPETGVTNPVGVYRVIYGTNNGTPTDANEMYRLEWGDRLGFKINPNNIAGYNTTINGNIGIGTATPATQIHLYNNSTTLNPGNFITLENRGSNTSYSTSHVIGGILFSGYNAAQTASNVAGIWVERSPESNNNSSSGEIVFGVTKTPQNIATDNQLPADVMRITHYGGLYLNSNLTNQDWNRPSPDDDVTSEIRGKSKSAFWMDDGFLRLSAGGGSSASTKSYIDLSGYTTSSSSDRYQNIVLGTSGIERLRVSYRGYVGIGTTKPTEMLSVKGTVLALKVKVSAVTSGDWPDYVFHPTYKLRSLSSLELFINENKHLPDVPSASAVEKDGLDVGATQAALLKKIEELTLYVIELNKKIEKLEAKK